MQDACCLLAGFANLEVTKLFGNKRLRGLYGGRRAKAETACTDKGALSQEQAPEGALSQETGHGRQSI